MSRFAALSVVAVCGMLGTARAEFIPGHIFVSEFPNKHCNLSGTTYHGDRIWEINPDTGEVTLFAELSTPEWCGGTLAMAFTPDGTRLRLAQWLRNRILELDENGTPTVLYDASDGIAAPFGANCITFDRSGNFYVASFDKITRFAPGAESGEIFADRVTDPLLGRTGGSVAVAKSGDLYFAGLSGGATLPRIVRFQGPHNGSLFESFSELRLVSIVSDSCDNLYISSSSDVDFGKVFRYTAGDPSSRTLLGNFLDSNGHVLALTPNESHLYLATYLMRKLYRLNLSDNSTVEIADLPNIVEGMAIVPVQNPPYGFVPCRDPVPATGAWGTLILALCLLIGGKLKSRDAVTLHLK